MLGSHNKPVRHQHVLTSIVEDKPLYWYLPIPTWAAFVVTFTAVGGFVSAIVLLAFPPAAFPAMLLGLLAAIIAGLIAGTTVVRQIMPGLTKKTPLRGVVEAIWADFTAPRGALEVTHTITPSRRATSWDITPTPRTVITARDNVHPDE